MCHSRQLGEPAPSARVRAALSRAVALPARACLLAVDASHLRPLPNDLYDVDRKQHGVKKKHGIKLSCDAVEDE